MGLDCMVKVKVIPSIRTCHRFAMKLRYLDKKNRDDDLKKVIKSGGHRARFHGTTLKNTAI